MAVPLHLIRIDPIRRYYDRLQCSELFGPPDADELRAYAILAVDLGLVDMPPRSALDTGLGWGNERFTDDLSTDILTCEPRCLRIAYSGDNRTITLHNHTGIPYSGNVKIEIQYLPNVPAM